MKRRFVLLLALWLTVGGLGAACGRPTAEAPSQATTSPGDDATETAAGNATASGKGKVVIEYWHVNSENFGGPAVRELVERFNRQHDDIQVVEKFQPNMYLGLMQNLQTALAAGQPPAVAQIGYNFLRYAVENFPHLSIEEAASRDPEGQLFLADFLPNILDLGRVDGKLEGMPYSISNAILYYNADLFQKAGLDPEKPPKTWAEVREAARTIREKTGAYGLYLQEPSDFWGQQALIESNGARMLIEKDGRLVAGFDSPEAIEAFQLYQDLVLKDKTALHATWDEGSEAFVQGKVAMYITTIARRNYIESNAQFTVKGAPFPAFDGKPRRLPAGGNNLFIFAQDPKEQEAAWTFIKFLLSPEAITVWTKGTGYLPARTGVADDPRYLKDFMDQNPLMKVAVAQLPDVVPWVSFPGANGLQAEQVLLDARDAVLTGKKSPEAALKEAAEKVNELIR
ncbi:MAG: ABC transporter substrate-binding protein [Hydrogenibacillus schlegelii]|nr:ABC transporter substrate-binding protein [Hydrogenibacillus schlegelii]